MSATQTRWDSVAVLYPVTQPSQPLQEQQVVAPLGRDQGWWCCLGLQPLGLLTNPTDVFTAAQKLW